MMIMQTRVLLACYIYVLSICLSESSTQKNLGEIEAVIRAYVDDLTSKDDGVHIASYEEEPNLLLGGHHQHGVKREQGTAGLWGRKRQASTTWEEQNHKKRRTQKTKSNEGLEKRAESLSNEQNYGSAGLWGKRQSPTRIADDLDTSWEEREQKKPPETGLWGKRATKGSSRLRRKARKLNKPQEKIGLWIGKRDGRVFNTRKDVENSGKRVPQSETGLWGRSLDSNSSRRKRLSGGRKKTVYGR